MIMISVIVSENSVTKIVKHKTNKQYSNNMNYMIIMISIIVLHNSVTI